MEPSTLLSPPVPPQHLLCPPAQVWGAAQTAPAQAGPQQLLLGCVHSVLGSWEIDRIDRIGSEARPPLPVVLLLLPEPCGVPGL